MNPNLLYQTKIVAESIEDTVRGLRLFCGRFTDLETVLREKIAPEALTLGILSVPELVDLCGEYLREVPWDALVGERSASNCKSRSDKQALVDQYFVRREVVDTHYRDHTRQEIDASVLETEARLFELAPFFYKSDAKKIAFDTFIHRTIPELRLSLYKQAGIEVHENPVVMDRLAFNLLAVKRGWMRREGRDYVLAGERDQLVKDLEEAGVNVNLFESYTGLKVNVVQDPVRDILLASVVTETEVSVEDRFLASWGAPSREACLASWKAPSREACLASWGVTSQALSPQNSLDGGNRYQGADSRSVYIPIRMTSIDGAS